MHGPCLFRTQNISSRGSDLTVGDISQSWTLLRASVSLRGDSHSSHRPKNARSFFQQRVDQIVLAGLLYLICEQWIDDLVIHGDKDDEFLKNLHKLFLRFRQYQCVLKLTKCKLDKSQTEYVGRVLSHDGTTMRDETIKTDSGFPETSELLSRSCLCKPLRVS